MASLLETPTRLWVCTNHDAHYAVGCASIVMANNEADARVLLGLALAEHGLDPAKPFTLVEINMSLPFARVLYDGNY